MRESRKPKRRNVIALDAALRRGGPHDTEPTRAEAEREAIAEQLFEAGAELDRAARMEARIDAALAECGALREDAERLRRELDAHAYYTRLDAVFDDGRQEAYDAAADRIERALRGEP